MTSLRLPVHGRSPLAAALLALCALLFVAAQLAAPVHALQHVRLGVPAAPATRPLPATPADTPGTHACPDCAAFAAVAFAAPLASLVPLPVIAAAVLACLPRAFAAPASVAPRARNRGPPQPSVDH